MMNCANKLKTSLPLNTRVRESFFDNNLTYAIQVLH